MNRVYKFFVVLLVFGLAVVIGAAGLGQQSNANAVGGYELYIINNPSDVSLYSYSVNGTDYYDVPGTLSDFINTYYAGITHTEPLNLYIGSAGAPLVTPYTITISKDTKAEIYLQNTYASTVDIEEFNRDIVIATASAIVLADEANLEVNKAFITTDGARAITNRSTGTLTVNGTEEETVIHSSNNARPTYGGTIYVENIDSALPAYVQNGGSVLNSCNIPYSSVILNQSQREIYVNAGNVVSTPATNPFGDYGHGVTAAIMNVLDGVINISQIGGRQTTIATANASNYYVGTINLSGVATGKTTLNITGGSILNLNTNSVFVGNCYTIYTANPNNIMISDAIVSNSCGYVVNHSGKGNLDISNTQISNSGITAIYMPDGNLFINDSVINASSLNQPAIRSNKGNVNIDDSEITNSGASVYVKEGTLFIDNSEIISSSATAIAVESDLGDVLIDRSNISNIGASVYAKERNLFITDSQISSTDPNCIALKADKGNVLIWGSSVESTNLLYGGLYMGSGDLLVDTSDFFGSPVLMFFEANENLIIFDNFTILGSVNTHIKIESEEENIYTPAGNYDIVAVNNTSADRFFRAWYNNDEHYSDSNIIEAEGLPEICELSIVFEYVYAFIQDPDMVNGTLISQTPVKNFKGLDVALEFRPATAYYLYEAYYFDSLLQKVSLYLHTGTVYINNLVNAIMTEGDTTVYANFKPIPITVSVNNITTNYGASNIRLIANINSYSGVTYYYSWYRDGIALEGKTDSYLQLYDVEDSGNYSVRVTSNLEGANTAEAFATATINPRNISVVWDEIKEFQYSGFSQYPEAVANDIDGNPLPLIYNGINHLVGRHTLSVQTSNPNYALTNNTITYDITPLSTTLVWSNLSFEYDGSSHRPTAYAEDVAGNPLHITVSGSQSDAREAPYTAYATTTDGSYVFVNAYVEFTINPTTATVYWYFEYTDTVYNMFFYNGYDQLMRIKAYYYSIYDYRMDLDVKVKGQTTNATVFMLPDTYEVVADFMYDTPNYVLKSNKTQANMFKARPYIAVPQNNFEYIYNGQPFSITANITYANSIVYLLDGREVENSFVQPGVYSLTLTSREDELHERAAEINVTLTILATSLAMNDDNGDTVATISNTNGIDPKASFVCEFNNNVTTQTNKKYTDLWGRSVLTVINLSLDAASDVEGTSKIRIKATDEILSNKVLKLRSIRDGKVLELSYTVDEEGYIEFETDTLGEYALVGASATNSIIGVAAFVLISIVIISSLIIYLVRRKKSVY